MFHATGVVNREVWEYSSFRDTLKPITPAADLKSTAELDKTVLQHLQPALPKRLHLINFLNCITVHFLITLGNHSWIVTGSLSIAQIILAVALSAYSLA